MGMAPRFLIILTGRNLPTIRQQAEPSTINYKTVADFTRVVEQTGPEVLPVHVKKPRK
jgi:hypothetical protein